MVVTATTKPQNGVSLVFPDVCHIPAPPPGGSLGVPVPYPNIATIAAQKQKQKQKVTGYKPTTVYKGFHGNEPGTLKEATSFGAVKLGLKQLAEVGQLKSTLNTLNVKLQGLPVTSPTEWQGVLQEYLVIASALYITQKDDDD
jgi:hypothetical protein